MSVKIARISAEPLDLSEHLDAIEHPEMGATTTFVGRVRNHDPDANDDVIALEYTAHPDAETTLHGIAEAAAAKHQDEVLIAVSHRIGRLSVGDAAVVIAVASPHRDDAFVACRDIIETIKRELPVWKRQIEADGTTAWKGIGG